MLELLLTDDRVDFYKFDNNDRTPVFRALQKRRVDVVYQLLASGRNLNVEEGCKTDNGESHRPSFLARSLPGGERLAELLLRYDIDRWRVVREARLHVGILYFPLPHTPKELPHNEYAEFLEAMAIDGENIRPASGAEKSGIAWRLRTLRHTE